MPVKVTFNRVTKGISLDHYLPIVSTIHRYLHEEATDGSGWVDLPLQSQEWQLEQIQCLASEIKNAADVLVVVGIGGSYIGSRAVHDALCPYFKKQTGVEVLYVGHHMSGTYMKQLLEQLEAKNVYVNVISKSGTTLEPALAFRLLKQFMEKRYGKTAKDRIIVTTDAVHGQLVEMSRFYGYRHLVVPASIGGRFSVLTPVGLLPLAVADLDINALMAGAKDAALALQDGDVRDNPAYQYAMIRHELYSAGYQVELLATFEPKLAALHEWWKQLFGESEGKEGKGLFPSSVTYSTDLHSLGQYVQQGAPILFETFLHVQQISGDCLVPNDELDMDSLGYLAGCSLNELNKITKEAVLAAHVSGGVPIVEIEVPRLDAFHLGYLLYFFMKACAMSAYLLEVNPFNQPGVAAYKDNIQKLLAERVMVN